MPCQTIFREFFQDLIIMHTHLEIKNMTFSFNAQSGAHLSFQGTKHRSEFLKKGLRSILFRAKILNWVTKCEHAAWHLKYWAHQMSATTKRKLQKLNFLLHKSRRRFLMRRLITPTPRTQVRRLQSKPRRHCVRGICKIYT